MSLANELPPDLRILYVEDVAPLLRLKPYTVRCMAREGKVGFRKEGKRYITTLAAVREYLEAFARHGTAGQAHA